MDDRESCKRERRGNIGAGIAPEKVAQELRVEICAGIAQEKVAQELRAGGFCRYCTENSTVVAQGNSTVVVQENLQ